MNRGLRHRRHQVILRLLREGNISSQEQLRRKLAQHGFKVTQATLSRDLKKLRAVKTAAHGKYRYTLVQDQPGAAVRNCQASGNLIVVHTDPGMAPAVAYRIDGLGWKQLLGTVAGEDTVLVVVREGEDARVVKEELWKVLLAP